MPAVRRALAVLPVAVLAYAAPSAQGAQVMTLPCVAYVAGERTMPVAGTGFTAGRSVTLYTSTPANPTPRILTSEPLDGIGGFRALTLPPPFTRFDDHLESFTLIAEDRSNPALPILATAPFQVVRFGMTRSPNPRRPSQRVKYTARGFAPGRRVYAHFRFAGKTRRTVSLGVAKAPCGITSRRMRALPTRPRRGVWRAYIDQSRRYSRTTRPQWVDSFRITRVLRPR